MSPLFSKKQNGKLIALIDIESGSVGSALVYIEEGKRPRLFAQERTHVGRASQGNLFKGIEKELEASLLRLNTTATRMRDALPAGEISRVAVFLHAPWVGTQVALERIVAQPHDEVIDALRRSARGYIDTAPVSFHSFSTTATPIIHGLFGNPEKSLVLSVGSEITELMLAQGGVLKGHVTTPLGFSTLVRTLKSHAGISDAEARSILNLSKRIDEHHWAEAVNASLTHFASELKNAAGQVVGSDEPQQVFILAPQNSSDWFARSLTQNPSLHELFSLGSTIRGVTYTHASPHLSGHPTHPDLPLSLESLFADTRFGSRV